jgi:hypothetical protein
MSTPKLFWQSKTFWLNVVTIGLAILAITDASLIPIDPKMLLWIIGVLNILLRFLTNQPITLTANQGSAK